MSEQARIVAVSAAIAVLLTALIMSCLMPLISKENLPRLLAHPIAGNVINTTAASVGALYRLLDPPPPRGARLSDVYPPHLLAELAAARGVGVLDVKDEDLDWSDPRVWEHQQQQVAQQGPRYTSEDIDKILYWCEGADGSPAGGSAGASSGDLGQTPFDRVAAWVNASGGDVSMVALAYDQHGVRGLQLTKPAVEGEMVLGVPVHLGLSVASSEAADSAAGATLPWRGLEDWDLYLDALALAYEVAVRRERSHWAQHACALPRSFRGLPMAASTPEEAALVAELPALRRLAAKRRAQTQLFSQLAESAVLRMFGGRPAIVRLRSGTNQPSTGKGAGAAGAGAAGSGGAPRNLWPALWQWAVEAARTRSVAVDMVQVGEETTAAYTSNRTAPPPLRLSLTLEELVGEVGAVFPVLDMANHGFSGEVANVQYKIVRSPAGHGGLLAALVALRPLQPGTQLLFDYAEGPELESGPACADRWVLEYGFMPASTNPKRDCDSLDITPRDVVAALSTTPTTAAPDGTGAQAQGPGEGEAAVKSGALAGLAARIEARLLAGGLPSRLQVQVRHPTEEEVASGQVGHVQQRWSVEAWIRVALDVVRQAGGQGGGAGGEEATAKGVLARVLEGRSRRLEEVEARARGAGGELGAGLAAVAAAARRALARALQEI